MGATPEALEGFRLVVPVRVAWGDMDAFGHVNNVRYFGYFEVARIAYFDEIGVMDRPVGPILASTSCRFRAPVRYPDELLVGARVTEIQADRFIVEHWIWSTALQTVAAKGDVVVVAYNYDTHAKAAVPESWRAGIQAFEGRAV